MIRIPCPFCGERDHSEFTYGGDGTINYPGLNAPKEARMPCIILRNPLNRNINFNGAELIFESLADFVAALKD